MLTSFMRRKPIRNAAMAAYVHIVAQAREPVFFTDYGVPDTLDGRYELICLHAFIYLHRLRELRPGSAALSQAVFDTMFGDLDRSLRELGTGDLSVGRHVKRMARGFYGRIHAYQDGIARGDAQLAAALVRNLYGTVGRGTVGRGTVGQGTLGEGTVAGPKAGIGEMTRYVRRAVAELARQSAADLLTGRIRFPVLSTERPVAAGAAASAAG
ncbi:MAG TPA: ubiquinol-cytochrome C chaperone family protein [Stellaceae bacterium]|nr:ubiquinol-cytochrome C chaperone family protein [Stellaceae bacterium]